MTKPFDITIEEERMRMMVSGKTLEEFFRNAVRGLASYANPALAGKGGANPGVLSSRSERVEEPVKVEAVDLASLLVEFLSLVIARADMNDVWYTDLRIDTLGENFLEGTLLGAPGKNTDTHIRSVLYEDVNITKNSETGFYETELVFEL